MVATTCAVPMSPSMSRGDTRIVSDLERIRPTVVRPKQSSVSSVGDLSAWKRPLRNPVLGWATIATCAVPPAEFAMVSTLSRRALSRLSPVRLRLFLWSVAVVMTKRPSANSMLSARSGMISPTIASRSAATRPVIQESVSLFFFSSSLAVNALWHGPDNDISGEKGGTQRNWPVPVKMANHHTKPQQHKQRRPANPPARLAFRLQSNKATRRTGPGPTKNNHK